MKKAVWSMFVLGLTSLGFSQGNNKEITPVTLAEVTVLALNSPYIASVQDQNTPEVA